MSNILKLKKSLQLGYFLVKILVADLYQIAGFKLLKRLFENRHVWRFFFTEIIGLGI